MPDLSENDLVAQLVRELRKARTLEHAARLTLAALLQVAGNALSLSEFAKKGAIRRAMLHLRPGAGYRQLVVEELEPRSELSREHNLFSATAFRWVTEHNQCVEI